MGRFEYHSHWPIAAPIEEVWHALTEVDDWPQWWPYVVRVQTLERGDADGLGSVRRIDWTSRLPYGFTLEVTCTEVRRLRLLRAQARGDLAGEGVWTLEPAGPARTDVRYVWRLDVHKPWMRLTAPLMAPVFRWNHEGVMAGGCAGLRRRLGSAGAGRAMPA